VSREKQRSPFYSLLCCRCRSTIRGRALDRMVTAPGLEGWVCFECRVKLERAHLERALTALDGIASNATACPACRAGVDVARAARAEIMAGRLPWPTL